MDTDAASCEIPLQTSDLLCRCCTSFLSNVKYPDMAEKQWSPSNIDFYEAMLKETFDIQLTHYTHSSKVICANCIRRLYEANCFKNMIVNSEETLFMQFQRMVEQTEQHNSEIKLDEIKVEAFPLLGSVEGGSDFIEDSRNGASSGDDEEILADIMSQSQMNKGHQETRNTEHPSKPKLRKSLRKRTKTNDVGKIAQVKKEPIECKKDWQKICERRGNGPILRENSLKLISNSTLCVFQWNKSRYRCFCCKEPYSDMNSLRTHMQEHNLEEIERKIITQQNRLVKVEVSLLRCKICEREIENLDTLKTHLQNHGVISSQEDLLVPFRIEHELKCQICSEKFSVFRLLNIHMNKHYQKQVCHVCGAGFSNLVFLNLHKSRSHKPFVCKPCNLVFANKVEKKNHDVKIHGVKIERKLRFPCPYCSERFFQENLRVLHLVEKHEMKKPAHKCMLCAKEFVTRSLCNNHVKNVHMKEKRHACDVCNCLFYTKSDVARHKVTHTGEKNYSCDLCSNVFASKDSLRRHTKRTHVTHGGV